MALIEFEDLPSTNTPINANNLNNNFGLLSSYIKVTATSNQEITTAGNLSVEFDYVGKNSDGNR